MVGHDFSQTNHGVFALKELQHQLQSRQPIHKATGMNDHKFTFRKEEGTEMKQEVLLVLGIRHTLQDTK